MRLVAARGDLPQAFRDRQRIYVVVNDDLKLLVRLYAAYQESKGWRAPLIVASLAHALEQLSVNADDFHPSLPTDKTAGTPATGSR